MLQLLQSNLVLVGGAVAALLLIAVRAASADRHLRRDLQGALFWLGGFLFLRFFGQGAQGLLPEQLNRAIRVGWMLMLAFGTARTVVAFLLWTLRLRSAVPPPKIVRDVLDFLLYAVAAISIVKSQLEVDLSGVLATSAVLSVVLGLALQDTLGNLFAGLSIQVERPFQVGDFVSIGQHTGRVLQVAWRATRLETFRREVITLPNSILSKEAVKNYSRAAAPVGIDLYFHLAYGTPPNVGRAAVLEVLTSIPAVLEDPEPRCRVWAYDPDGIRFQVRYFVADYAQADTVMDEFYSRLWYRLRRDSIEIPYPQRTLHLRAEEKRSEVPEEMVSMLLDSVEIFSVLAPAQRAQLQREMTLRRFGRGERILEQGAAGHTFYLVVSGEVSVRTGTPEVEVARLKRGQHFGEMSLLTGEPRAATVVATSDAVLLELDRPAFARLFAEHQHLARQLSAILAQRRSLLRAAEEEAAGSGSGHAELSREAGRIFGRLRQIFGFQPD